MIRRVSERSCDMRKFTVRITSIFLLLTLIFLSAVHASAAERLRGDTDGDGQVTILDATAIQRLLASIITDDDVTISKYGDVDGDGLTIMDATAIQRYLAGFDNEHHIGEPFDGTEKPVVVINGNSITVDGVKFDVSGVPDEYTVNSPNEAYKMFVIPHSGTIIPEYCMIQVNNGEYDLKVDYTDERFKENYLTVKNDKPALGYDCLVRNEKGEEAAWIYAHYSSSYAYPFRAEICALKNEGCSFPVDFYYKGILIKRCNISISLEEDKPSIASVKSEVRKIEEACWSDDMSEKEKLKAFSNYVADHYTYAQVMCVTGAEYVAFAARDLGLTSMLLYPGGEENQHCGRHLITYNIYQSTGVPGGHCAALVQYDDGSVIRYDVQGYSSWIRVYDDPYQIFK